ncbi:MAG: FAD-dependent oxidoreductase [Rhizobiales bacterium]|nr:FAD-dependent oxidoreductase [Hyphomicrobiales bacterium]
MKDYAQVVVIGGGIVGCSLLYHLAALGWQDALLLEKAELAAGATSLAAGNVDRFDLTPNLIRLRDDSIRLYERMAERQDRTFSYRRSGGIILATSETRLDELKRRAGLGRPLGMPHLLLSRREILDHHPLIDLAGVVGGLYDPLAGSVDPQALTDVLARAARSLGAEISEQTAVLAMSQEADGSWLVITDRGEIVADVVVNAAGLWARPVAAMIDQDLPIVAIEHQYAVTGPIEEVRELGGSLPFLCEPDSAFYLRAEGDGLLLGAFEAEPRSWPAPGAALPSGPGNHVIDGDPERLSPYLAKAGKRLPCLADAPLQTTITGPISMTPDGRPLLGPLPGFANYFVASGFMNGLSLAGGAGKALAEWIIEGEPPLDLFALDVARFGAFAGRNYASRAAKEAYRRHFAIRFPNDRPCAGGPLKRSAVHDKLAAHGAQFDIHFGWERPCWFAANASERLAVRSFRRGPHHDAIKRECQALRQNVGIADLTSVFAKHVFEGPDAGAILDRIFASRLPESIGAISEGLMLNRKGQVAGLFMVARISAEGFYVLGPAMREQLHQRRFEPCLPSEGMLYAPVSVRYGVLGLAGPKARILLARTTDEDVSGKALPNLAAKEIEVAGSPAQVMRFSLTGDLGFALHLPMEYMATVYEALFVAGQDLGLLDVGVGAIESLRLEAGFDGLAGEDPHDLYPHEAGLDGLIDRHKTDFIGRAALLAQEEQGVVRRRVLAAVEAGIADAIGGEPVYRSNAMIGSVITGGFGHHAGQSLAKILLPVDFAKPETDIAIDILGQRRKAVVLDAPPFDQANQPLSI